MSQFELMANCDEVMIFIFWFEPNIGQENFHYKLVWKLSQQYSVSMTTVTTREFSTYFLVIN